LQLFDNFHLILLPVEDFRKKYPLLKKGIFYFSNNSNRQKRRRESCELLFTKCFESQLQFNEEVINEAVIPL
jgi:hypothetical protein